MKRTRRQDVSFWEDPSAKRYKGNPDTSTFKKVMVLLASDVIFMGSGEVGMSTTIDMAKLKKPEKGQYKNRIKLTFEMTEEDVLRQLRLHFPILRNKRY